MPAPETVLPTASPPYNDNESRPPRDLPIAAGQTQERTGAGHQESDMPAPATLPSSRSPPHHAIESRPSHTTSITADQALEGTGAGQQELKLRGSIEGEKVTFALPIPAIITCDLCRPSVSWRRKQCKPRDALRHLQEQHDARFVAAFRCHQCGYATTTLHAGNRHLSRSCTGVRTLEEAPQEMGPTELREDGTLVLLWPARPSSCPIANCIFTTSTSGVTVATSIDHQHRPPPGPEARQTDGQETVAVYLQH